MSARVRVVFHLPFDSGLELWRYPPTKLAAAIQEPEPKAQLVLQEYAEATRTRLLRRLPHKVWEVPIEPPTETIDLLQEEGGLRWIFEQAQVSIWNSGAGLLVLTCAVEAPAAWTWNDVSEGADLAPAKLRTSTEWATAVESALVGPRTELGAALCPSARQRDPLPVSFSWCHRTVYVEPDDWDRLSATAIADTFVWDGVACELGRPVPHSVVRLALTACQVTHPRTKAMDVEEREIVQALERLVGVHAVIWQALLTCELELQEAAEEWTTHRKDRPGALQSRLDALLDLYESTLRYTESLRDVTVHLASIDGPIWRALSGQWELEHRMNGIEARLHATRDLYATATASASTRQTQSFTYFAWVLTLLGAVSTCLAVVQFIAPSQSTGSRMMTVAATVWAVVSVWMAFWFWQQGLLTGRPQPGRRRVRRPRG